MAKHAKKASGLHPGALLLVFLVTSAAWIAFDRATKAVADTATPGDIFVDNVGGLFQFQLVHNTGAAWGVFSGSTAALGIFSLIACVVVVVALFTFVRRQGTYLMALCLSLVFAGGLGNAIDRIAYGYVVDFIKTTFVEFPVFNVADIGVTCGIIVFIVALFARQSSDGEGR